MKRGYMKFFSCWKLLSVVMLMAAAACEPIYEAEADCAPAYYLEFVYDMNMDYADAFAAKVPSVSVYAFDAATEELAGVFTEQGEALGREGYRMRLDLSPGTYEFVAWCGLADHDDHFSVPENVGRLEDAGCTLFREYDTGGKAFLAKELSALFHGRIAASLPDDYLEHTYTVPLVKNTNNINLSLQEISGKALDPDRFDIRLTARNGMMAFDNSLVEDEDIDFCPYVKRWGTAEVEGSRAEDDVVRHDVIVTEMSTSRLIAGEEPTVTIFDKDAGSVIYTIPLVRWALMLKSQQYHSMGDQEYLDREDEFNVILYMKGENEVIPDEPDHYLAVGVMINGWRLVINDGTELGGGSN